MNKGSGAIIAIIVVCIVVAIVVYFFARTNSKQENEEHLQNNESEYIFDINEEDVTGGEQTTGDQNVASEMQELSGQVKNNDAVEISVSSERSSTNESPATGSGSVVAVIAIVIATISAVVIYKKQERMSAL